MKKSIALILSGVFALMLQSCYGQSSPAQKEQKKSPAYSKTDSGAVNRSNEEWKKMLSPEVYEVARLKGTERPFTSEYEHSKEVGTFYCAVCGNALFRSNAKYESGCGWPSFFEPISKSSILEAADNSHGMRRTEVMCGKCKSHLGHVFEDGPPPTDFVTASTVLCLILKKRKQRRKSLTARRKPTAEARIFSDIKF